jgi:flagellar hook protein FlgE
MFSIPLSGLAASSNALSVIANNLANLNTTGFKDQEASFQDLFYQMIGSTGAGNPIQLGTGTKVGSVSSNFNDGSPNTTGVATDAAITGKGFFVTENNGVTEFTRDGHFTISPSGELMTQNGYSAMGYLAVNGVIPPGQALSPIMLGQGQISPPAATTTMQMTANLDATAANGTTFSAPPLMVYDSLGVSHLLTFQFTKESGGAWSYQITIPAADLGQTGNPVVIASGSAANNNDLIFDSSGKLTSPAANVSGIAITGLADGAANMSVTWSLYDASGNPLLTQVASQSTQSSTFQNGYSSGTLMSFSIGSDGMIQGTFSNGQTSAIAQLALANFANEQGLQRVGANSYLSTLASGAPVIGVPGAGGRGNLTGGALEQSNVDIATEFAKMIVTQRGFQANAKVVTTFDQVTQDTINLKQ